MSQQAVSHMRKISLLGEPCRDGTLQNFYWATCEDHGLICEKTRDITERTYAVKFHLDGKM